MKIDPIVVAVFIVFIAFTSWAITTVFKAGANAERLSYGTTATWQVDKPTPVPTPEDTRNSTSKEVVLVTPTIDEDLMTKQLYMLANWKLKNLVETDFWDHDNSNGTTFAERVNTIGLKAAGEILYKGPCDYTKAITLWERSESHKEILMDTSYTHMVAVMGRNDKFCYIVQEYAK